MSCPIFPGCRTSAESCCPLADQVRRAVAWVYRNAERIGGDPNRIHVAGQSSGAHLASVLLTTDWHGLFGLPADLIKGGVCISGMYDLKPVWLSARSSYVLFDDETENALSAIRHVDMLRAPTIVAYGSLETPEFQRTLGAGHILECGFRKSKPYLPSKPHASRVVRSVGRDRDMGGSDLVHPHKDCAELVARAYWDGTGP